MEVIEGRGKAKPNHFGCSRCAHDNGSEIPASKPHSLVREVVISTHQKRRIEYEKFSYACDECGHQIMTAEQCEDLELERNLAKMEIDYDLEVLK